MTTTVEATITNDEDNDGGMEQKYGWGRISVEIIFLISRKMVEADDDDCHS